MSGILSRVSENMRRVDSFVAISSLKKRNYFSMVGVFSIFRRSPFQMGLEIVALSHSFLSLQSSCLSSKLHNEYFN